MRGFQENELSQVISIDKKKCKGCDSCVNFCAGKAIDGKYICEECFDQLQESDWIEVES